MKKQKKEIPETEYSKLKSLLSAYEKILHPDLFNPIMKQLSKTYDELKEQAYRDAGISSEALEIEAILKQAIYGLNVFKEQPDERSVSFYCKSAFKQILPIFKKFINGK